MSRCNYNVLFYRLLCATLLATAFTFTVILTNVFIDIDWLLSNKNKPNINLSEPSYIAPNKYELIEEPESEVHNFERNKDDKIDPFDRTKRSIETESLQLHVKDPGLKKILTSRLASLLKELDEEETKNEEMKSEITTITPPNSFGKMLARNKIQNVIKNEDLLHLAMHNILLQGMIGHMDLNDVYKKVHLLVNNFNNISDKSEDKNARILDTIVNSKEVTETKNNNLYNEEHKFFEELINCKKLENQIYKNKQSNVKKSTKVDVSEGDNKVYIKTVIEINENNENNNKINLTNSTENIEGLVRLIYNGKPVKINEINDTILIDNKKKEIDVESINEIRNIEELKTIKSQPSIKYKKNPLLNNLIEEYMKTHSSNYDFMANNGEIKSFKSKRLKRQIKIRYFDEKTNNKTKPVPNTDKKDDDDVYIEIETHFDGKGIKGEKKKKLVRSLIEKIQKALHSDIHETNKNVEHIKFVKRTQDPIDGNKYVLFKKITPPLKDIKQRQLEPIDKTLNTHENVVNTIEDSWKNVEGPRFLSISKSVNSAEMRELNVEYDSVLRNGIPKRLQKPINTDMQDEDDNTTSTYVNNDIGNVTLFLKDIDGSGFSIGINQYVGEPPDKYSMKMFNGLENLIKEYHQTYDQEVSNESDINKVDNEILKVNNKAINRNEKNSHKTLKRSIQDMKNIYNNKIFFKNNYLPFEKYLKIFKCNHDKTTCKSKKINITTISINELSRKYNLSKVPIIRDEKTINKLTSPKLLTLTNLINRKKRSLIVKKISNVKSKIKLSKFINTNAMANKKIFLKNKRNKRQINKIRIIARDGPQVSPKNSDENIFLLSNENIYPNKATVIKEFEKSNSMTDAHNQDHYDEVYPTRDFYRAQQHSVPIYADIYEDKRIPNRLMSKYPHIFVNNDFGSNEDFTDDTYGTNEKPYRIQSKFNQNKLKQETIRADTIATASSETSIPKVEEIINAIMPPGTRANYKLTVKLSPKNISNISTGFKEVHTSVNKTFDENGLRYFSLFNVSQISKIEKLNKTSDLKQDKINTINIKPFNSHLKEQQMQIKTLLQLHKKRVDQQLDNLLRESKHLEKMIEANSKNNINKTLNILHEDLVESEVTNDDKMNKILTSIKKLQESYNLIKNNSKTDTYFMTTEKPRNLTNKPEIIYTIKSNEKVTNEILRRIDTNTNILKAFLEKLSDNLKSDQKVRSVSTTEKSPEIKLNLATDWKKQYRNTFYGQDENKNATIPFLYAYQQNKGSLASMVYHANAIRNDLDDFKAQNKIQPNNENFNNDNPKFNGSKFFMDEFQNDYKIVPNKPSVVANIKINTTKV